MQGIVQAPPERVVFAHGRSPEHTPHRTLDPGPGVRPGRLRCHATAVPQSRWHLQRQAHRPQLRRVALVLPLPARHLVAAVYLARGVLVSGDQRDLCTRLSGVRCGGPGRTRGLRRRLARRSSFGVLLQRADPGHDRLRPHLAHRHSRQSDSRDRIAGRSRHLRVDYRDCFRTVLQAAARDPLQRLRRGRAVPGHYRIHVPAGQYARQRTVRRHAPTSRSPAGAAAGPSTNGCSNR